MYRVLLADDEQIKRAALAKCLKRHSYGSLNISEAVNGAEALETFKREKSQVVIMDIFIPEMSRVEAAERIRGLDEGYITIFLIAYDEFSYAKRAIVIRALDYLLELCEEDELVAIMEETMRPMGKRLSVPGVPSPGVPSLGVSSPGAPSPGIPSPDIRREKRAEVMSRDDGDRCLAQVTETIQKYIRNNYMKGISIQDVAKMMNYSGAYFCKLFKQHFGQSFTSYLTGFRVNEAKELLKGRGIGVKDMSIQVGYYDFNYFVRVFKRMTGMTPSEYRDSETAQKQSRFFVHLCEDNQGKMGKDKAFFLYNKLLQCKMEALGYIVKKVLRRYQEILTSSG